MKKILMLLALLLCFSACGGDVPAVSDLPDTTLPPAPPMQLLMADLGQYDVVRPTEAGTVCKTATTALYHALHALCEEVTIKEDFFREGIASLAMGEYEILVGATNRPESAEFLADLRYADYGYTLIGKKLVIAGHTEETTAQAVEAFCRDVLENQSGEVLFSADNAQICNADYAVDALTLGGIAIDEFRIVFPPTGTMGEEALAERFASAVARTSGDVLEVIEGGETSALALHTIYIGGSAAADLAENEGCVDFDGSNITFRAPNAAALSHIVSHVIDGFAGKQAETLDLKLEAETRSSFDAAPMTAMSFNIYCNDFTQTRINRVLTMIRSHMPDTVGVQEATTNWMNTLKKELGDVYEFVGEGRDGGTKGEHSAIGYKKSVYRLVETDTFWLSDTPEQVSKVPESSLNRVFTYALLERISDGVQVMVVNTHFEHTSDAARERQAEVLAAYLQKWAGYPLILTGDFNTKPGTTAYNIVRGGGVENCSSLARIKTSPATAVTFNNYGKSNSVIDFVFTNQNAIVVEDYRVCDEQIDGNYPSDHLPVLVEYIITK
ncbi:MAG: endonuclease/exonuclease/phosphatase family protein [Clostridia bacterium]|nr:endonuclease/exonuclease/phosphatase family protein [Clostridia bacterium]